MENENVQPTTYTEEDVAKLIQSASDKVRTEYSAKLKEKEDSSSTYETKLKELEQKEQEIAKKEKMFKVSETLKNNGLDSQLSKYLNLEGVEDIESYTKEVAGVIQKHITDSAINNSFKPSNHVGNKDAISKDDFMKMSYADRVNLFKSNEELYKRLSK
jgi:hypothetical protein